MKSVPKLRQLVEEIAEKHAFDLHQTGAYLRLDLHGDRLIVENIGTNRISIAYQLSLHGIWTSDPDIVVWTGHLATDNPWIPIELNQAEEGWQACAEIDATGQMIGFHCREWQARLAEFVETEVVSNLIHQCWLEHGVKSDQPPPTYTVEEMRERGYLLEEEPLSSEEQEEVWHDIPF